MERIAEHIKANWYEYFTTIAVNLVSLTAGGSIGWANPYLSKLKSEDNHAPLSKPLDTSETAWVACLLSLSCLIATLTSGVIADKIGRKLTFLIYALPMLASDILFIFSGTVIHLYIARILVGISVGAIWTLVPLYVAEISKPENRGFTSLFFQFLCSIGQLITYVVGQFVSIRVHAIISLSYTVSFFVIFGLFAPESPYYLAISENFDKIEAVLVRLRRTEDVKEEVALVINSVEQSKIKKSQADSWTEIFKSKPVRKALSVTLGLFLFQQLSGSAALSIYLQTIFEETKSSIPSHICLITVSVMQIITMFVTSRFIDMLDRKIFLFWTTIGIMIALAGLAVYFHFQLLNYNMDAFFWLPVTCVLIYYMLFSMGIGGVTFIIVGEIFPTNHLRTYLNGIATTLCIGMAFSVSMAFPHVVEAVGMAWPMWGFTIFCGIALIFIVFYVPETRGKTLLDIQLMLQDGRLK